MAYYLAMHEAPCVGVAPIAFEADNDRDAEDIAFVQSIDSPYYVSGGYDLYRIVWNSATHQHELSMVIPEDVTNEDDAILPCDLDPLGECPKPEYARNCAKCRE